MQTFFLKFKMMPTSYLVLVLMVTCISFMVIGCEEKGPVALVEEARTIQTTGDTPILKATETTMAETFTSAPSPEVHHYVNPDIQKILVSPTSRVWYDIPYDVQSPAQKLDIYIPESGDGPFPLIFAIHGGGFTGGDKALSTVNSRMQLQGIERGYAVVQINYRLSKETTFPEPFYDVKAALRFIKANAKHFSLDPDKIVAWGDSAGGSLAALLGTSSGITELEDLTSGNSEQVGTVQAVIDLYGDVYLDPENTMRLRYLGIPENAVKASAPTYITPDDPPFFIQHGTKDGVVNYQESIDFYHALIQVKGEEDVELSLLEGAGHASNDFEEAENVALIYGFIDRYLK